MLTVQQARTVASQLLDALARDTKHLSAAVAELEALRGEWEETDPEAARFMAVLETIGELTSRYRTGESILTIRKRDPEVERLRQWKQSAKAACICGAALPE